MLLGVNNDNECVRVGSGMAEASDGFRRVHLLVLSLRSLLECCAKLEDQDVTLSSCIFLCGELVFELRKLEEKIIQIKPAND